MPSLFHTWLATSRHTVRRDLSLFALLTTLSVAACGGVTATTYSPACAAPKYCYATAGYYTLNTDFSKIPQGVFNDVPIEPMGCNTACVNEHGVIYSYLLLADAKFHNWVEVGQSDNVFIAGGLAGGGPYYYDALYQGNSQVAFHLLGKSTSADIGQTGDFALHVVNPACTGSQSAFPPQPPCPPTTTPSGAYVSVAVPSGNYTDTLLFANPPIVPGGVEFGMKLQGAQGESAVARQWSTGKYATLDLSPSDLSTLTPNAETSGDFSYILKNGGHVSDPQPPFGVWVGLEGNSYIWFETWCCR